MRLWAVVARTGGDHSMEGVYSVWSTQARAALEILRLARQDRVHGWVYHVVPIDPDIPSDTWIGDD